MFSLILLIILVSAGYVLFAQSKYLSSDSIISVEIENAPCISTSSAKIKKIEEKIENTTESVDSELVEKDDRKETVTLQEVVAEYFAVANLSSITIGQQTETHAQGELSQNWWLAFNDYNDGWRIITSGCSYINCHEISGYDFPTEMAPICWDTSNNQLVNR